MASLRLGFLGDVMLGRGVAERIAEAPPGALWGDVGERVRQCDLAIANLECAITERGRPWSRWPKVFHFRAPPDAVEVLRAGGIDAVSLANNHILDYEEEGLLDTLEHLDRGGIGRAGAGRDLAEALRPALLRVGRLRVGLVAFTDNEPGWVAGHARPGVAFLEPRADEAVLRLVGDGIDRARQRGADLIVLSLHWGPNMRDRPSQPFRAFARAVVGLGVDVVHGHSAHLVQGVEVLDGALVLYDTGDALDDYAVDPRLRNDLSFLFAVRVEDGRPSALELLPLKLEFAAVRRARGEDFELACRRMTARSRALGTRLVPTDEGLRVDLP